MTVTWEIVWERLNTGLQRLIEEVARTNARVRPMAGWHSTEVFPFRAFLSFNAAGGPDADELLVVSVDCKLEATELALSSDITTGPGDVLAEGPVARIGTEDAIGHDATHAVLAWVDQVVAFIDERRQVVASQVEAQP